MKLVRYIDAALVLWASPAVAHDFKKCRKIKSDTDCFGAVRAAPTPPVRDHRQQALPPCDRASGVCYPK